MGALPNANYISEQDYLDGERISETRHEYIDGRVVAMAGASRRHSEIAVNIASALRTVTRGSGCKVYASDVKVRVVGRKTFYYPDVLVGCEPDDVNEYYLEKPCLVVEVLSDSTAKRDRTEKLLAYMNIATLQAYLLVEQDLPEISLFYRDTDGRWWVETFTGLDAVIPLPCPSMTLALADVYEGVGMNI